jgi:hypothetical protein
LFLTTLHCRRQLQRRSALRAAQVQAQLRKGNADVARGTLGREAELSELRNQIAIIRCAREGASSPRPRDDTQSIRHHAVRRFI